MDGDRDRNPHWSTGLSSQGPNEEQKEGEHEQGSQDHEGCIHPLRRWDSPRQAGLGMMEHVIKLDTLNVAGNEAKHGLLRPKLCFEERSASVALDFLFPVY